MIPGDEIFMNRNSVHLHVHENAAAVALAAAGWIHGLASRAGGGFTVCLSGGSTPRQLYVMLARAPLVETFPWQRVHWFWGDERFVAHDHPDSNYRMVRTAMFDAVDFPSANIHPIDTSLADPDVAAEHYERLLAEHHGGGSLHAERPLFDVTLLGIGEDGHTASLFPGTPTLDIHDRWVASTTGSRPEPRITLTFPALNASRHVAFLACGAGKRDILAAIWRGEDFPAGRVRACGDTHWFLDEEACPPEIRKHPPRATVRRP